MDSEIEELKKVLEDAFQTHDVMAHYVVNYQMAAFVWRKCAEAYERGDLAMGDKLFSEALRKHG